MYGMLDWFLLGCEDDMHPCAFECFVSCHSRIWSKKSEQEVVCHQGLLIHLTIAEPNAREFHFSQVHACHVLTLAHASHLDNVPSRLDLGLSCTECKHSRVNDQRMEIMDGNRIRVRKMRVLGNWVNFGQS
ncbi:unnamed protein product [Lathyrus oleraceus]